MTFILLVVLLLNTVYNIILLSRILYGNILWPSFLNLQKTKTWISRPSWNIITITQDLTRLEFFSLGILTFYSIFFGIWPNIFLFAFTRDYLLSLI
jgi:NADH:ubiquinone oxidoreductase subunit 4 (subunit M)